MVLVGRITEAHLLTTGVSRESVDAERDVDLPAEHSEKSGLSDSLLHTIVHRTGPIDIDHHTVVLALDLDLVAKEEIFGHLILVKSGHIETTSLRNLRAGVDRRRLLAVEHLGETGNGRLRTTLEVSPLGSVSVETFASSDHFLVTDDDLIKVDILEERKIDIGRLIAPVVLVDLRLTSDVLVHSTLGAGGSRSVGLGPTLSGFFAIGGFGVGIVALTIVGTGAGSGFGGGTVILCIGSGFHSTFALGLDTIVGTLTGLVAFLLTGITGRHTVAVLVAIDGIGNLDAHVAVASIVASTSGLSLLGSIVLLVNLFGAFVLHTPIVDLAGEIADFLKSLGVGSTVHEDHFFVRKLNIALEPLEVAVESVDELERVGIAVTHAEEVTVTHLGITSTVVASKTSVLPLDESVDADILNDIEVVLGDHVDGAENFLKKNFHVGRISEDRVGTFVTDEHITKTLRAIPVGHGENAVLHIEARGGHGGIDSNTDVFGGEQASESGSDLKHVVRFLLGDCRKEGSLPSRLDFTISVEKSRKK